LSLERETSAFTARSVQREVIRPEVRLPLDQCILWSDCCKKV